MPPEGSDTEVSRLGWEGDVWCEYSQVSLRTQCRLFQSHLQGGKKRSSGRGGGGEEGRTETKALNLARCDIPEKNNTVSSCCCCCYWRKTETDRGGKRRYQEMMIIPNFVQKVLYSRQKASNESFTVVKRKQ